VLSVLVVGAGDAVLSVLGVVLVLVLVVVFELLLAAFAIATFWLLTDEPRAGSFPEAIWT
jgi:hypothetical protein